MKRFRFIGLLFFFCLIQNFLIRAILTIQEWNNLESPILNIFIIFGMGLYNDILFFSYFMILGVLYFMLIPEFIFKTSWHSRLMQFFCFGILAFFSFVAHAEWFFWQEFKSRFNFIAVDYLLYTREILGNIQESYPMSRVYALILISAGLLYFLGRKWIRRASQPSSPIPFSQRLRMGGLLLLLPVFTFFIFGKWFRNISDSTIIDQLSKNGAYEFFSAALSSELSYERFFKTLNPDSVISAMQKELSSTNSQDVENPTQSSLRWIKNNGPEKKYNIIIISVESLSAEYLGAYTPSSHLTPHLDRLVQESVWFKYFYAVGTRTVRGLEAMSLSLPPTPGHSIIRRAHNEHLFSIGTLFKQRGYDTKFIYGGYGVFDNMNYFFQNNDFSIVDRLNFNQDEIHFSNIWGVCDEDLFSKTLKEGDISYSQKTPFFHLVMTTTNHRPFTYPDGRIDIPSHTGRDGGVKYTDFAIHRFLEEASHKPWFKDTLFVILADHCAGGRGKTVISPHDFHIPLLIYAPFILKPQVIDKVCSQIDLAPTLAGLENFTYQSKFFGKDIFKMTPMEERAVMGQYQFLGFLKDNSLVVLSPGKRADYFHYTRDSLDTPRTAPNPTILESAIGYYQYASYLLSHGLYQK